MVRYFFSAFLLPCGIVRHFHFPQSRVKLYFKWLVFTPISSEVEHFFTYFPLLVFASVSCLYTSLVYVSACVFVFFLLIYRCCSNYILYSNLFLYLQSKYSLLLVFWICKFLGNTTWVQFTALLLMLFFFSRTGTILRLFLFPMDVTIN